MSQSQSVQTRLSVQGCIDSHGAPSSCRWFASHRPERRSDIILVDVAGVAGRAHSLELGLDEGTGSIMREIVGVADVLLVGTKLEQGTDRRARYEWLTLPMSNIPNSTTSIANGVGDPVKLDVIVHTLLQAVNAHAKWRDYNHAICRLHLWRQDRADRTRPQLESLTRTGRKVLRSANRIDLGFDERLCL